MPQSKALEKLAICTLFALSMQGCVSEKSACGQKLISNNDTTAKEQPLPLTRAYAHNDYKQNLPLQDALDNGFLSVEADIFNRNGKLPVAHTFLEIKDGVTLENLYLKPLAKRVKENKGHVYPNSDLTFLLMIDMKSSGDQVYKDLYDKLKSYEWMLTKYKDGIIQKNAVTTVITGHQPSNKFIKSLGNEHYIFLDGCKDDVTHKSSPFLKSIISMKWAKEIKWHGNKPMPEKQKEKLHNLVAQIHSNGQQMRLWAIPESETVWQELYNAGVDLINTDNLPRLRKFLMAKDHSPVKTMPSLPVDTLSNKSFAAVPK